MSSLFQRLGIAILVASSFNIINDVINPQPSIAEVITLSDGTRCEGEFKGRNGRGLCVYSEDPSGQPYDYYRGEILNGQPNGRGVLVYGNRDRYEGQFRNSLPHGVGMFLFANGDRYEGNLYNGQPSGNGIFTFANRDRYQGNFFNGQPHGRGSFTFADGQRYIGDFYLGQVNGQGEVILPNGMRCEGTFYNSNLDGKGTCTNVQGSSSRRYTGEIRNGQPGGRGTYN
ncbi:MAG TPA: hypothetical protein DCL61_30670 [Cyanobacteria bacterium UBA12227]|nr:hypothetical protein [Cyanobacteria bacterium UBA12227]HAX90412.1 hypothetical protein [Cyanobacteria bacterium UBA11370]HBY81188.1 hypothetical protein [Cyanobacteria bacterium UBA11148]